MKHITKPVFILLALCMIAGLLPWTAVDARAQSSYGHPGSGTMNDPWQIENAQQWEDFANGMVSLNNSTYGDDY